MIMHPFLSLCTGWTCRLKLTIAFLWFLCSPCPKRLREVRNNALWVLSGVLISHMILNSWYRVVWDEAEAQIYAIQAVSATALPAVRVWLTTNVQLIIPIVLALFPLFLMSK